MKKKKSRVVSVEEKLEEEQKTSHTLAAKLHQSVTSGETEVTYGEKSHPSKQQFRCRKINLWTKLKMYSVNVLSMFL